MITFLKLALQQYAFSLLVVLFLHSNVQAAEQEAANHSILVVLPQNSNELYSPADLIKVKNQVRRQVKLLAGSTATVITWGLLYLWLACPGMQCRLW